MNFEWRLQGRREDPSVTTLRPRGRALACLACALALGCVGPDLPSQARVRVEGGSTEPLELVVSSHFLLTTNETTQQREAELLGADTIAVSGSFEGSYGIAAFARVYVALTNRAPDPQAARLIVYLDESRSFDDMDVLEQGERLQFLFTSRAAR